MTAPRSLLSRALSFVVLPHEVTSFEDNYVRRVNRIALAFFALHVPAFALLAWLNETGPLQAVLLTTAVWLGPFVACRTLPSPRAVSVVFGVTAMFMGGLLVHFGQGPVQIEMHFYFFALLAMLAVWGNPLVIVAAAVTVALHHLLLWYFLPTSVFNYDAPIWVVLVHAAFVLLESVATCFIARSFFDNVIGLERIVEQRTQELDSRRQQMRLVLDNIEQGLVTVEPDGSMSPEHSRAMEAWLGPITPGESLFRFLSRSDPKFAESLEMAWEQVYDGVLPADTTLGQLPTRLYKGDRVYEARYQPLGAAEIPERILMVLSDATARIEQERAEAERRETLLVFERLLADRSGFIDFIEEGTSIVQLLLRDEPLSLSSFQRLVHTLKGNAALFGMGTVASACHDLEELVEEQGELPARDALRPLSTAWRRVTGDVERLLGSHRNTIELDAEQLAAFERAIKRGTKSGELLDLLCDLKLEPAARRLALAAEQARRIAQRVGKAPPQVVIEDHQVRLDSKRWAPFWYAFVHAVRNAVDHGIESDAERAETGKPVGGRITLRTKPLADSFVIEIADDGRGVDWQLVREQALQLGLPSSTEGELVEALFAHGLSTADQVTDISGRGVGMGTLREVVRSLGGELEITSATGQGTVLRATFSREAMRGGGGTASAA